MIQDYNSWLFVETLTRRYHNCTGNYPTKTQAIQMIQHARRTHLTPPRAYWSRECAKKRTYSRFMALELIRRIQKSEEPDPIRTIYEVYSWLDDQLCADESGRIVWQFSEAMKNAINKIMDLLGMEGANT